jgi:hypothetical protein
LDLIVVLVEGLDSEMGAESSVKLFIRDCLEVADVGEYGGFDV